MVEKNSHKGLIIVFFVTIIIIFIFYILLNNKVINTTNSGEEYFHKYEVNEVQSLYISLEEVSQNYLSELVGMVVYEPKYLYNILDLNTKEKFNKYDDFLNYLERIKTIKFLKGKVLKYSSSIIDGKNVIRVIDAAGNNILFIESGINNYTVRFEL